MEHQRRRPSFAWPLLLILAGAGFLLTNLGILSGDFWGLISIYWPVLFIVFALDNIWQGDGIAGAILGIGIGVIFLLANLGYLNVSVWDIIIRFWPLLIIAAGLDLLVGRHGGARSLISALAGLLVVAGLAVGVFWLSRSAGQPVQGSLQDIREVRGGASQFQAKLNMIAGNLNIEGSSQGDDLVQGTIATQRGETLNQDFRRDGSTAYLSLGINSVTLGFGPFTTTPNQGRWDLVFNTDVDTDLGVNLVAGQLVADLSSLQITALNTDVVFGQTTITLPEEGRFEGDVSTLVGETVIRIPQGASVRINAESLIGMVAIPDGYTRDGDWVYSPTAKAGSALIELEVDTLIGKVELEEVP